MGCLRKFCLPIMFSKVPLNPVGLKQRGCVQGVTGSLVAPVIIVKVFLSC